MRLSVVAVLLVLFFSQSAFPQHSSSGGFSSGGGTSSGSSGGVSSGGSARGSGYSGGGGSSSGSAGGTSSSGSTSYGSGSSGPGRSEVWIQSGTSYTHDPAKAELSHGNSTALAHEREIDLYSTAPGDSSAFHDQLLDQALTKIQYELPANLKSDQLISAKSLRPSLANHTDLAQPKDENQKKVAVPDTRPCHGGKCRHFPPPSPPRCEIPTNGPCIAGGAWRVSQQFYQTIQDDCEYLNRQLAREERKAATRRARRDTACVTNPQNSSCLSATSELDKSDAKISRLHDRYDRCVLQDLRHKASFSISNK